MPTFKCYSISGNVLLKKKPLIIIALIATLFGGGYFLLLTFSKQNAIEAIEELNQASQSIFGNSQITYDDIYVNLFRRTAVLEKPVYSIAGKQILIADKIEISGVSNKLEFADISNMEITFSYDKLIFALSASHLQIEELDLDMNENLLSINDSVLETVLLILQAIEIDKFEAKDFLLKGGGDAQDAAITATGNLFIEDFKNAIAKKINIGGSIIDNSKILANELYKFEAGQIELLGLDLKSVIAAVKSNGSESLLQINREFGISKLNFEEVLFVLPEDEIKTVIAKGNLEVEGNIIEEFLIRGIQFQVKPKKTDIMIAELSVEGLDLGIDFSSEDEVYQNASRLFGINDLRFLEVAFMFEGIPINLAELRLSDIVTDSGFIISGNSILSGLEIPISAVTIFDETIARKISKVVESDNIKGSFRNEYNYEIGKNHYRNFIELELDKLAELDINLELDAVNLDFIRSGISNQTIGLLANSAREIELKQIQFEYRDLELVDIIFETHPQIGQGIDLIKLQASLMLMQYPEQQKALIGALNDFQNERNRLGFSVDSINALKISNVPELFVSGNLAEHASFEFYGK